MHQQTLGELRREIGIGIAEAGCGELFSLDAAGTLRRLRTARAKTGR